MYAGMNGFKFNIFFFFFFFNLLEQFKVNNATRRKKVKVSLFGEKLKWHYKMSKNNFCF